jgi:hypothetical protein
MIFGAHRYQEEVPAEESPSLLPALPSNGAVAMVKAAVIYGSIFWAVTRILDHGATLLFTKSRKKRSRR